MFVLHIYLLTICLGISQVSFGYEVINNEIIERIDLDNGQDLQHLTSGVKTSTPKISHHVDKLPSNGGDPNSVQTYHDTVGVSSNQPSIIYAAIQATPHIIASRNGEETDQTKVSTLTILQEPSDTTVENTKSQSKVQESSDDKKPSNKLEDPNEDKSKNVKAKLITHLKQTLPKLYSMLSAEMQNKQEVSSEPKKETQETVTTLKRVNIEPYATIIDDDKDLKAEQSEDNYPYVVYDKQDYAKPKSVKKTVKTHRIGDEKKNVYPKEEGKGFEYKKDDLETDNTIWIGYGLGVPYRYPYPYNYPSSMYSYGRPYSGWGTRGYTGGSYYGGYLDRTGLGYYNNYGTGYGPYGGYL
ncbi:hypothetical protein WDU94_014219 [Cyamophila willieti]